MTLTQTVRNQLYDTIFKDLPIQSVFEVGVGNGEFAEWAKHRGLRYMGMDNDPIKVDNLHRWGFDCRYGVAPIIPYYPNMGSFDCVYVAHVVEYLSGYDAIMGLIDNCKGIVNPNGYIVFLYPDIERVKWTFYHDFTHTYPTSKRRVEEIMISAGLHIVKSAYYVGCVVKLAWFLHIVSRMIPSADIKARLQLCGMTIGRV